MTILSTLAAVFGIIGSFSMIPQVYKIFKRKSAKDLSIITYSALLIGGIIWILYGLEISSLPIILTNIVGTLLGSLIIIGWFLYGR